jgi:polysaccharide biosynthesis protein PslG
MSNGIIEQILLFSQEVNAKVDKLLANLPSLNPASGHQFGFTANAFQSLSASDQIAWLNDMKALGTSWLRFDANWHAIGSNNWGQLDTAVNACRAAGMNVCLILDGNGANTNMWVPPVPADFATFCKSVVTRYASKGVHTYEVWNEPNNTTFWSTGVDAAQYTAVLKAAYPAIKAADSASTVLAGGMCPCAVAPITFLQGMYAAGARGFFDALSLHPYTYPATPDAGIRWQEINNTTPSIRSVMAANGDSALQVWITEFGAPTSQYSNAVTEAQQASQLIQAITAVKSWSWAGPMFFYTYLTSEADPHSNEDFFGIVHKDRTPKPAYAAVKTAIGS